MFDVCAEPTKDDNVCENAQVYAQKCADAGSPVVGGWLQLSFISETISLNCCELFSTIQTVAVNRFSFILSAGWRSKSFCPMECPDTFVFDSCGKGCFPTCADPSPDNCKEQCTEGCYCPEGNWCQNHTSLANSSISGPQLRNSQIFSFTLADWDFFRHGATRWRVYRFSRLQMYLRRKIRGQRSVVEWHRAMWNVHVQRRWYYWVH